MTDWDDGDYARTALELEPAAEVVVEAAGAGPGDRLLDVGCGTGNALVAAARRGASVLGVDPAPGLVARARARLDDEGLAGAVATGTALDLRDEPDHRDFDAALSVFGVIFAPDPPADLAAMARALRPGGRIALSAWVPDGPLAGVLGALRRLAGPAPAGRGPAWHDAREAGAVLSAAGLRDPGLAEHALTFRAASPEGWLAEQERHHPAWLGVRAGTSPAAWEAFRGEALALLEEGNEDPGSFAVTSRYVVLTARR